MRIAYLTNRYPAVTHSFIRREILALEGLGFTVLRFAARGWNEAMPDPADQAESKRTRYLLRAGPATLLSAMVREFVKQPVRWLRALALTARCTRRSFRPWPVHLAYLAQACLLKEWLDREDIRHLHCHFGTNPADVAMLVQCLGGPPYSLTVHGSEEFDRPEALSLGEKLLRARFVVGVSSFGRSQLYRWLPALHWSKVQVVHCGIDRAFVRAGAAVPPCREPRLVCVGRLCEQKGQILLVEAVSLLVREGIEVELVLAGDGDMREDIEAAAKRLGVESNVRITGWVSGERVRAEILASRAMVLPSFAEGLPVVLMEAMALQRPVISTYVAGIPELVEPGRSGWLVPAGDAAALARAMRECLELGQADLQRMGALARERVLERHDIDREVAGLATLFSRYGAAEREPIADGSTVEAAGR